MASSSLFEADPPLATMMDVKCSEKALVFLSLWNFPSVQSTSTP
jgi:hypothetical protein